MRPLLDCLSLFDESLDWQVDDDCDDDDDSFLASPESEWS